MSIAVTFHYSSIGPDGLLHLWQDTINVADIPALESSLARWSQLEDFRIIHVAHARRGNPSSWHTSPVSGR